VLLEDRAREHTAYPVGVYETHARTLTVIQGVPSPVSLRCPSCGQNGTFESTGVSDLQALDMQAATAQSVRVGTRICPNQACKLLLFVVTDLQAGGIVAAYPPEVIDLDTTNIPTAVQHALSEAITCHANECYIAAAIMVRKTLEELCADRGAEGSNLKERISALRDKVVVPEELLTGADDLRLLGNDAAHIESQVYAQVGREEVAVGIEFAKELLKAVYQMSALLQRLRGLKAQQQGE
jgi:hypothetical protein